MSKHLLIIRLSAFGDVAMVVPAVRVLRNKYPELKITVLTKEIFSSLFNQIDDINFLFFKQKHKSIKGVFSLSKEINKIKPDQIIDLHNVIRTKLLRIFLSFRINNFRVLNKGRRQKISLIKGGPLIKLKSMHQRYLEALELSTNKLSFDSFIYYKKLNISQMNLKLAKNKKLIGIAPFAMHMCKQYSLNKILKIIELLEIDYNILIFCAEGEEEKLIKTKSNLHIISSKYSLADQMAVMSNIDIMLSMDSANGHIASLFGINVITLWGATHPYVGYAPFGQPEKNSLLPDKKLFPRTPVTIYGANCPKNYVDAINSIKVEDIVKRINNTI